MSSGLLRNGLKVHGVRELEDDIHWSGFTGAVLEPVLGPGLESGLGFGSGKRDYLEEILNSIIKHFQILEIYHQSTFN